MAAERNQRRTLGELRVSTRRDAFPQLSCFCSSRAILQVLSPRRHHSPCAAGNQRALWEATAGGSQGGTTGREQAVRGNSAGIRATTEAFRDLR